MVSNILKAYKCSVPYLYTYQNETYRRLVDKIVSVIDKNTPLPIIRYPYTKDFLYEHIDAMLLQIAMMVLTDRGMDIIDTLSYIHPKGDVESFVKHALYNPNVIPLLRSWVDQVRLDTDMTTINSDIIIVTPIHNGVVSICHYQTDR